jgi:hypothetical protein
MARYIDADALYKETEKKIKEANSYRMAVVDGEFLDLINDAETADVAPKREIALEIIDKIQRPLTMYKRPIFSYDLILQEMIKAIGAVIEEYTEGKV